MKSYFLSQSCFYPIHFASLRSQSSFNYTSLSVSLNPLPRKRLKKISIHLFHEKEDCNFCRRKSTMLMRSAIIPVFTLTSADHIRKVKQMFGYGALNNLSHSFLSILVGLGILGCIAFYVLYALTKKLRDENRAIVESMQIDLDQTYASLVSMEKDFKLKMLNEKEEQKKQNDRIHKEKLDLIEKIRMGRRMLANLGRDLAREKHLTDDLTYRLENSRISVIKVHQEKKELRGKLYKEAYYFEEHRDTILQLRLKIKDNRKIISYCQELISQKEIDLAKMNTSITQQLNELNFCHGEVKKQKEKLLKTNSEMKTANGSFTNLTAQIISLSSERDKAINQFEDIKYQLKDLGSFSSVKEAARRSELLSVIDCEIVHLKEHIDLASNELTRNQLLQSSLVQEKDELKKKIDIETAISKNLLSRLQTIEQTMEESRSSAFNIVSKLRCSKALLSKLKNELLKARAEFAYSKDILEKEMNEVNSCSLITKAEIDKTGLQLAATAEVVNFHGKAMNIGRTVEEEKNRGEVLKTEIRELERRMLEERKRRETVEKQLVVGRKALEGMKKNMLLVSEEVALVNLRMDGLRKEIKGIVCLIEEEKDGWNKAKVDLEYVNGVVDRLRKDENELKKVNERMEGELSCAKGEILRERNEVN